MEAAYINQIHYMITYERFSKNMIKDINNRIYIWLMTVVLIIYGIVMFYFCIRTDALVPDEIWFQEIVESLTDYSFLDLIRVPNHLGYGSLYWITMAALKSILAMRLFSWGCMLIIPICISIVLKKKFNRTWKSIFIAILLWVSCPMTWFTGKIIGPELYGNALGSIGVTIILMKKNQKVYDWRYTGGG